MITTPQTMPLLTVVVGKETEIPIHLNPILEHDKVTEIVEQVGFENTKKWQNLVEGIGYFDWEKEI